MGHWVSFPGLGINELPISPILLEFTVLGRPITVTFYGAIIALGFVLAILYGYVRAPKVGVDRDAMIDVVLVSTVVAVLCARLYYVVFYDLSYYLAHPGKILAIWDGGLAIYGGIIGAFITGYAMCRARKVCVRAMFDLTAVGFLIGQGIGRWGNFFNQEAYGTNTLLPWGMTGDIIQSEIHGALPNSAVPVHPTFLYESLWCLLGALVLHILFVKGYKFKGQIFASYLIWYGVGRFFIESLRTDSLMIGPMRVSQLVAVVTVLLGAALLLVLGRRAKTEAVTTEDGATITLADDETETVTIDPEEDENTKEITKEDTDNGDDH